MSTLILFDSTKDWLNLLPITFTRSISEIRLGATTLIEKWQKIAPDFEVVSLGTAYLKPEKIKINNDSVWVKSTILPNEDFVAQIKKLNLGHAIFEKSELLAFKGKLDDFEAGSFDKKIDNKAALSYFNRITDIFTKCGEHLESDFKTLTFGKESAKLSPTVTVIGDKNKLFIEEGAILEACILNVNSGPIYISKNAELMEGSMVRGPFFLGEGSVLKMGAKIYGPSSFGPHCKVGGEVNNSVILGYSNKAHDGFLGNSVIGEWCNLGADTNNSNLKNNYGEVSIFNYQTKSFEKTGLQFCGMFMGDYSKAGINTMFNTGTVIGVGCNIFGSGFPEKHLPSFTWGGLESNSNYQLDKLFETSSEVYKRRGLVFGEKEKNLLHSILEYTRN